MGEKYGKLDWPDECNINQYAYRNLPEDFLEESNKRSKVGKKRKLLHAEVVMSYRKYWFDNYPPLKPLQEMQQGSRQSEVQKWVRWREEHTKDKRNGSDASGPIALAMVLGFWGEFVNPDEVVAAKHTWAYHLKGVPSGSSVWLELEHAWDKEPRAGGYSDGAKKKYPYTRIDAATPAKLMALAERLINDPDNANYRIGYGGHLEASTSTYNFTGEKFSYEWAQYDPHGDTFPFNSDEDAEEWLKEQIDEGVPIICSYVQGPGLDKYGNVQNQGSDGHDVVVNGYDEEQFYVADPLCGSVVAVPKSGITRKLRFKKKDGKKLKWVEEEIDIGFMAAWKRKGYRYLRITDNEKIAPKEKEVLNAPTAEAAADKKPKDIPRSVATMTASFMGYERCQRYLSELKRDGNGEPYYKLKGDGGELTLTGKWDSATKDAVRAFQQDQEGLTANGRLTKETKAALSDAMAAARRAEAEAAAADQTDEEEEAEVEFLHGHWSTQTAFFGSTVSIEVRTAGIDDGKPVEICVREKDPEGRISSEMLKVKNNVVSFELDFSFRDAKSKEAKENSNEFYFVCDDLKGVERTFDVTPLKLVPDPIPEKPPWIENAEKEMRRDPPVVDSKRGGGKQSFDRICKYHEASNKNIKISDTVAWCASFVNWCLEQAGFEHTHDSYAHSYGYVPRTNTSGKKAWAALAKNYVERYAGDENENDGLTEWIEMKGGNYLPEPAYGCIAFMINPANNPGTHVGFIVGEIDDDTLMMLGGNQGGTVKLSPKKKSWMKAYTYPPGWEYDDNVYNLPEIETTVSDADLKEKT
jgi:hypothetical protein